MPDEVFGELIAFTDVEQGVLGHYKKWMNTWLSARERHQGIAVGTISRPRSYIVKQSFTALPGEEQTPLVIAVSNGFAAEPQRRGTGRHDALFRFGIAVVCMGGGEGQARALCGHYQTAILGIAMRHRWIADIKATMHDFVNLAIEDIDEEATGRSMSAVRLTLVYKVNDFIAESPQPELLVDTVPPQPDAPDVETVEIETDIYRESEVFQ